MVHQRSNNNLKGREYAGPFQDAFMSPNVRHSLEATVKVDGTLSLVINYKSVNDQQSFQAIMLTNEQRRDLGEFLLKDNPEQWVDKKEASQ